MPNQKKKSDLKWKTVFVLYSTLCDQLISQLIKHLAVQIVAFASSVHLQNQISLPAS